MVNVIQRQDNTVVQGLVLFYAAISILGLLVGDILMAIVDPRITFGKKKVAADAPVPLQRPQDPAAQPERGRGPLPELFRARIF